MQTAGRLQKHQNELLHDIAVAASEGDAARVLALQKKLETLASLIRRQEEINQALQDFERTPAAASDASVTPTERAALDDDRISAKERGRRRREEFVQLLASRGVVMYPLKGAVLRTPRKTRVGIAYGRLGKNEYWFLGLPEGGFDQAVLLCEDRSGTVTHFSLTREFMGEHGGALSRKNGQVKFNVVRRGGEFFLHVPRRDPVTLEPFRDNFAGLI